MSTAHFAVAVEVLEAYPGVNATRYLTLAGLVVLLYDHFLLIAQEIRVVWKARWSYTKGLFLLNRYLVPACLILNVHMLGGLSTAGLSTSVCRKWLPATTILGFSSLAIANVFIVQRVWALWGRNPMILKLLIGVFICVYIITFTITAVTFVQISPDVSFSPLLRTCIVTSKPKMLMAMYGVPIILDISIFVLTSWNAFDRPRHMEAAITKQLVNDGIVYFVCIMSLRILNMLILAIADVSYIMLGLSFLWAMATVTINRMLIISGAVEVHPGPDPSGVETPFRMLNLQHWDGNDPDDEDDDDALDVYRLPSFIELDGKPNRPPGSR